MRRVSTNTLYSHRLQYGFLNRLDNCSKYDIYRQNLSATYLKPIGFNIIYIPKRLSTESKSLKILYEENVLLNENKKKDINKQKEFEEKLEMERRTIQLKRDREEREKAKEKIRKTIKTWFMALVHSMLEDGKKWNSIFESIKTNINSYSNVLYILEYTNGCGYKCCQLIERSKRCDCKSNYYLNDSDKIYPLSSELSLDNMLDRFKEDHHYNNDGIKSKYIELSYKIDKQEHFLDKCEIILLSTYELISSGDWRAGGTDQKNYSIKVCIKF